MQLQKLDQDIIAERYFEAKTVARILIEILIKNIFISRTLIILLPPKKWFSKKLTEETEEKNAGHEFRVTTMTSLLRTEMRTNTLTNVQKKNGQQGFLWEEKKDFELVRVDEKTKIFLRHTRWKVRSENKRYKNVREGDFILFSREYYVILLVNVTLTQIHILHFVHRKETFSNKAWYCNNFSTEISWFSLGWAQHLSRDKSCMGCFRQNHRATQWNWEYRSEFEKGKVKAQHAYQRKTVNLPLISKRQKIIKTL